MTRAEDASVADGERERLAALDRFAVLDTPPEPAFDTIVQLAAHLCRAPMALISFVGRDRLFFKSELGFGARRAPRTASFCDHAIAGGDAFCLITDAAGHPSFAGHPFVVGEPRIRFYAGAPLRTRDGYNIGTLCVIDRVPRPDFGPADRSALEHLAGLVMDELELRAQLAARRRAEAALRDHQEKLTVALEAATLGSWELDLVTQEMTCSDQCRANFGRPAGAPFSYGDLLEAIHPDDRAEMCAAVANAAARRDGGEYAAECRALRPGGDVRWILVRGRVLAGADGRPARMLGVTMDVTEHRLAEERARQRSKLEALGTLASGIAHDFNNLLLGLAGVLESALADLPAGGGAARRLGLALEATERGRTLVQEILAFGRQEALGRELVPLEAEVARAVELAEAGTPPNVALRRRIEPVGEALVAPGQIDRMVLNLCRNAIEAIGVERPGTIAIGLERLDLDAAFSAEAGLGLAAGAYACLTVRDDGPGMTPEIRERVLEPFFTTKEAGQSAGMGLAVVDGIAASHGGTVTVESEPGDGVCVTVYLPLAEPESALLAPRGEEGARGGAAGR